MGHAEHPGVPEPCTSEAKNNDTIVRRRRHAASGRPLRRAALAHPPSHSGRAVHELRIPQPHAWSQDHRDQRWRLDSMPVAGRSVRGCCCPDMDGPDDRSRVQRRSRTTSRAAHAGFTPTLLSQLNRPPSTSLSRRRGLSPRGSPATFPCTSMIRCAFLSSFVRAVRFAAPACVPSGSSGFRSGRSGIAVSCRPQCAFSRPDYGERLAPRRQRATSDQALSPQELTHLATRSISCTRYQLQSTGPQLVSDGLLEPFSPWRPIYLTSGIRRSCRASLVPRPVPAWHYHSRFQFSLAVGNMFGGSCLRPTLILCVLCVSRTLAERDPAARRLRPARSSDRYL